MTATTAKTDRFGVRINARGYAIGIECHLDHGGNRGMVWNSGEWYECQGCGNFRHAHAIREEQGRGGAESAR